MMEAFRPIVVDSVVLSVVNTGEIGPADFVAAVTGTALGPPGRRRFVEAFERRLALEVTPPAVRLSALDAPPHSGAGGCWGGSC